MVHGSAARGFEEAVPRRIAGVEVGRASAGVDSSDELDRAGRHLAANGRWEERSLYAAVYLT